MLVGYWYFLSYLFLLFCTLHQMGMVLLVHCHFVVLVLVHYLVVSGLILDVCLDLHHLLLSWGWLLLRHLHNSCLRNGFISVMGWYLLFGWCRYFLRLDWWCLLLGSILLHELVHDIVNLFNRLGSLFDSFRLRLDMSLFDFGDELVPGLSALRSFCILLLQHCLPHILKVRCRYLLVVYALFYSSQLRVINSWFHLRFWLHCGNWLWNRCFLLFGWSRLGNWILNYRSQGYWLDHWLVRLYLAGWQLLHNCMLHYCLHIHSLWLMRSQYLLLLGFLLRLLLDPYWLDRNWCDLHRCRRGWLFHNNWLRRSMYTFSLGRYFACCLLEHL